MGSACFKSAKNGAELHLPSEVVDLKTKKQFQKSWESKHRNQKADVVSVWGLSIAMQDIYNVYEFEKKEIGAGHYGVVRRAHLKINPNSIYAVKSVKKEKLKGDIELFKNELEMLRFSDHPNIIQFFEIYQDSKYFHFVMELCEGGDITGRIENGQPFSEEGAKRIIFQMLLAVNHLHSCNIVHRDIKPDNFLFKTKDVNSPIKLTDFGLSRKIVPGSRLNSLLGTPFYVAPEVLEKKGYNEKCDLWSIGVTMYLLLSKQFPFKGQTTAELFLKIKQAEFSLGEHENLRKLSSEGKQVIRGLLEKNPSKRLTASEALRCNWFDNLNIELNEKGKAVLTRKVASNLRSFQSESKFTKEVIRLLVINHPEEPQVMSLRDAFFYIDVLNNGVLTTMELRKIFDELGEEIADKELEDILKSLELRTRGVITFTEFISATIPNHFYSNEKSLEEVFQRFDIDKDQYISFEDVQDCFCRFGVELPKKEITMMIRDFDENNDGKISKEEFFKMMKKDFHRVSSFVQVESPSQKVHMDDVLRRNA